MQCNVGILHEQRRGLIEELRETVIDEIMSFSGSFVSPFLSDSFSLEYV